ncbi:MAG: hypothetical protein AAGD86_08125 [Pseudomonadota bacterium]
METLIGLVESGRIVDLMLAFIAVELVLLIAWHRRTGHGIAPLPLLLNVGAGGSLMLALRAVLTGAGWQAVTAFLLLSLAFHLGDLAQRWRRAVA